MRWDRFFEDLEDQLTSEWEAERAALDSEAERLRLSRVTLRQRLAALVDRDPIAPAPTIEVHGGAVSGEVTRVGADWVAVAVSRAAAAIVPFAAIEHIALSHADILRSARPAEQPPSALSERMGLGFVLRDLSRRRAAVEVRLVDGRGLAGTIDRAGIDHCDLALHDPGSPRRASDVTGFRLVPFAAIAWVRADDPSAP